MMTTRSVGLTHIGKVWHGLSNYVSIRCEPYSYLDRKNYVPLFDEGHITCFKCLATATPYKPGEGAWRES